jgi:cAMP-specific phosphodiesterase 4
MPDKIVPEGSKTCPPPGARKIVFKNPNASSSSQKTASARYTSDKKNERNSAQRRSSKTTSTLFMKGWSAAGKLVHVTDKWLEDEQAAIAAMNQFTLKFSDTPDEHKFMTHLKHIHQNHHYGIAFKTAMVLLSMFFISMYDMLGAGGAMADSEEMKDYYSTRLKWDTGVCVVWFAIFMASVKLPMQEKSNSWQLVCMVGGPLVFAFKEGANLFTYHDRYNQLIKSQTVSCDWTNETLTLSESNFVMAYFFNSCGSSMFVLLLIHAVLKFQWDGIVTTTSTMVILTIALAVFLETEMIKEFSYSRLISTALFSTAMGSVFLTFCYYHERNCRMAWFKTHNHVLEITRIKETIKDTKLVKNVKSGMDAVLNTLIAVHLDTSDPHASQELLKVISTLRSGQNLWEASHSDMNDMPTWLQEQNRAYMMKKENDAYMKKHAKSEVTAREVRKVSSLAGILFEEGERVVVCKPGSHTGKQGLVSQADWNGRIQVKMDEGTIKSYMSNEISKLKAVKGERIGANVTQYYTNQQILFARIDEWGFDVLGLQKQLHQERLTAGEKDTERGLDSLVVLGMHLFERHRVEGLGLDMDNLLLYLQTVEKLYTPNPYHNAMHGADCMRGIHYFYVSTELQGLLTHEEKFAGLFAGAVHDVQHPGVNTQFLCNTSDPLAITYNDISPLENMHCATAFKAAAETKVLDALGSATQRIIRKQVVTMVLATDLAQHFSTLAKFKAKVEKFKATLAEGEGTTSEGGNDIIVRGNSQGALEGSPILQAMLKGETDDRLDVLCMCIKNSDIGHAAKPWELHQQWSKRILQEFFNQGDVERGRNMAISSLCDRHATDVWKGQIGFIDFLAMPQAKVWCECLNSDKVRKDIIDSMNTNKEHWNLKVEEGADQYHFTDVDRLRESFFELSFEKELLDGAPASLLKLPASAVRIKQPALLDPIIER